MKSIRCLLFILFASCFCRLAPGQTTSPEGLVYTVSGGAATITGYTGSGGSVAIPATLGGVPVTTISLRAFADKTTITGVSIPASVTSIGLNAFVKCSGLLSIAVDAANSAYASSSDGRALLNKSQTQLIQYALGTSGTYAIPATVTSVAEGAFQGSPGLSSVTLPNSVTSIGDLVFAECPNLASATLSTNLTAISRWAFRGTALTSITLPAGITFIGQSAFEGTRLTTVAIPGAMVTLQPEVFRNCNSLASITVDAANAAFSSVDGVMFDKAKTTVVAYPAAKAPTYVVPAGITKIGAGAFHSNLNLTGLTLPSGLTTIERDAFEGCSNLSAITIPASVTGIGEEAFLYASKLSVIYFLGSPPTIGASAFSGTAVAKLYYQSGATGWSASHAGLPTAVLTAPVITSHPAGLAASPGASATLSVVAVGGTTLSYQWYKGLAPITSATSSAYSITSAQLSDMARYWVSVSNSAGTAKSNNAGSVFAGLGDHSFYLKADGSLWGVGLNTNGELGTGSTTNTSSAVQVAANVRAVAAGLGHTLFVDITGTLWATGLNSVGQLGDGTTTDRSSPVRVAVDVVAVAAGNYHSLFVKSDGSLWAMGSNWNGETGSAGGSTPKIIASGVSAVAAGVDHSVFLKYDGSAWAIGANSAGQLGDGSLTKRTAPVQVATGVAAIAANGYHTLFLKSDGTLWGAGNNAEGELADGTTTNRSTPIQMASGVSLIAAGKQHSMWVKLDGTLWTAGINSAGGLGTAPRPRGPPRCRWPAMWPTSPAARCTACL